MRIIMTRTLFLLVLIMFLFVTVVSAAPGDLKSKGNLGGMGDDIAYGVDTYRTDNFVIGGRIVEASVGTGHFDTLTKKGGTDGIVTVFDYDSYTDNYAPGYMYNFGGEGSDTLQAIAENVNTSWGEFLSENSFTGVGYSAADSFETYDFQYSPEKGGIDAISANINFWPGDQYGYNDASSAADDHFYAMAKTLMIYPNGETDGGFIAAGDINSKPAICDIGYYGNPNDPILINGNGFGTFKGIYANSNAVIDWDAYYNCLAVGYADAANFGVGNWSTNPGKGGIDAIFANISPNNWEINFIIWKKNFGGDGDDYFNAITKISDGNYIAAGYSTSASFDTDDFVGVVGKGLNDATIVKFDDNNNVIWAKNFGGEGDDVFTSVAATADGGFVAVGYSSAASFNTGDLLGVTGKGSIDAIVVKFNANGTVIWKKNFGGSDDDYFNGVTVKKKGDVIAVGYSYDGSFENGDLSNIAGKGGTDITYAVFNDLDIYRVRFLTYSNNKDIAYKEDYVATGTIITAPLVIPERLGYDFMGWYTTAQNNVPFNFSTPITSDTYVYPKWRADGSNVTIDYCLDGSGTYTSESKTYGSKVTLTATATSSADSTPFRYWADDNGNIRSYNQTYTFSAMNTMELTAVFSNTSVTPVPTVNIDTNNILRADLADGERCNLSYFGDIEVPSGFTVIERGFVVAYDLDGEMTNLTLDTPRSSKILVPGTNTKVQAIVKNVFKDWLDIHARTFLKYNDGITDHIVYSPDTAIYVPEPEPEPEPDL